MASVALQGAGWGVSSIVRPLIVAEILGRRNFGTISGMLAIPAMAAAALAPAGGAVLWRIGGYDLMILTGMSASIVGLVTLVLASKWRPAIV
jgi:hypothetical protein